LPFSKAARKAVKGTRKKKTARTVTIVDVVRFSLGSGLYGIA
jgi:hypothetical protein